VSGAVLREGEGDFGLRVIRDFKCATLQKARGKQGPSCRMKKRHCLWVLKDGGKYLRDVQSKRPGGDFSRA